MRVAVALPLALLAACGGEPPAPQPSGGPEAIPSTAAADPLATPATLPPQVSDFPALESRTCMDVARFYSDALASGAYDRAALAWADPVIDGARLRALLDKYRQPTIAWGEPTQEGAAGSSYCTIEGTLTDAADPARAPAAGTLILKRVNDVEGASAEQLRWTIRSSTFIETLERSGTGSPA